MTVNKTFRDYATRVSFNMSLSRNQIAHLATLVAELEAESEAYEVRHAARAVVMDPEQANKWYVGYRALESMGLISDDPRWTAEKARLAECEKRGERQIMKYTGPTRRITEAGEHVVILLRIAGLIHPAASNVNKKRKRKAA